MIRVAVGQLPDATPEALAFAAQLGVGSVHVNSPPLPGASRWERADIEELHGRVLRAGLALEAIENIPNRFYERAMLGLDGRDEEIQNVAATIRHVGESGIPILGFHFMPGSVWRTSVSTLGRGGARVTSFDLAVAEDPAMGDQVFIARRDRSLDDPFVRAAHFAEGTSLDDDALWANFEYFLRGVIPTAEAAGVTLALHPDDPPVPTLGGISRLFRSVDALDRAMNVVPSPNLALDLCLGTVSEMGGRAAVMDAIARFGPRDKIAYVHLRDVRGTVPRFDECFLGEGNYDPLEVILALRSVGFSSFIIDDHVPRMTDDTDYMHRGRAQAVGYIQGLLEATAVDRPHDRLRP